MGLAIGDKSFRCSLPAAVSDIADRAVLDCNNEVEAGSDILRPASELTAPRFGNRL